MPKTSKNLRAIRYEWRSGGWWLIGECQVLEITDNCIKILEGIWPFRKGKWYPRPSMGIRFELIEEKDE